MFFPKKSVGIECVGKNERLMMTVSETISFRELESLCEEKIADSELLIREGRYRSAYYICGYAMEMALKRRICITLGWRSGYPNTRKSFENLHSFKTHNLDILLHLSGMEELIQDGYVFAWSLVSEWDPEIRYSTGHVDEEMALSMLTATKTLLEVL